MNKRGRIYYFQLVGDVCTKCFATLYSVTNRVTFSGYWMFNPNLQQLLNVEFPILLKLLNISYVCSKCDTDTA